MDKAFARYCLFLKIFLSFGTEKILNHEISKEILSKDYRLKSQMTERFKYDYLTKHMVVKWLKEYV